jgi:hypothetical protein
VASGAIGDGFSVGIGIGNGTGHAQGGGSLSDKTGGA